MSTETQGTADAMEEMGTKPGPEHAWLQQLVGEWNVVTEMTMGPDQPPMRSESKESVRSLGGLWAFGQGTGPMPNGESMEYFSAIGYDVSFKEYRGCWFASVSSHLWKYTGEMSADGRKLTLNCVGPHMSKDGETANYRDVIEIIDANHRTLTSFGEDDEGKWQSFMKATYTRTA